MGTTSVSTDGYTDKDDGACVCTTEHYSAGKAHAILALPATQGPSEGQAAWISQVHKDRHQTVSLLCASTHDK